MTERLRSYAVYGADIELIRHLAKHTPGVLQSELKFKERWKMKSLVNAIKDGK
jgi:hypothetical protein